MNNNLSRQLCELCGIKPKKVKKCRAGECCIVFPCCEGRWGDSSCYIEQTIDFTKPENFVRLLEIIHDNTSMGAFLIRNLSYCYPFVEDFLRVLNKFSNGKMEYSKSFINDIKQSIREAEWIYE